MFKLFPCVASLSSCSLNVLDPKGPVGAGDATILIDAAVVMLAIVIPTILLTFWMAWHYRAANTAADYFPYWSYSGRIEAVVWSIPVLTIIFIGGLIWIGSYRLDPFRPLSSAIKPLDVQVVSLDWKWLFIYPDQGIATVNQLVVPAGVPVRFAITSSTVFNVFFIPRLGSMVYAMPGMVSQLHLQADGPEDDLWGISAQFSGDGFSDMNFAVKSVPIVEFGSWVEGVKQSGRDLDRPAYMNMLKQNQRVDPSIYRTVTPNLFNSIVTQDIPPGPGPVSQSADHTGREVSTGGEDR